jgi:integrase
MKLTDSVLTLTLPDGKKDIIHFDDDRAGFGFRLRAGARGKILRSWVVQYRRAGTSRRLLIGPADLINAKQARARAEQILAKVKLGEDPQTDKAERRSKDQITMRAVVAEYLAAKDDWRPSTRRDNERYLTGPYFKPLHGMAVDRVEQRDVASRLLAIKREHGAIVAAAARAKLAAFFTWAMQQGLIELNRRNPVAGTPRPKRASERERILDNDELVKIWNVCTDGDHGKVVRLMILTGCRRQEIGGLRWSEIAPDRSTWTLPRARAKNKRPLTLPLLPAMREIIDDVPEMVGRDQLFGQRSEKGFGGWDKLKQSIDKASGVTNWTLHDLRRTVATRMADIGVQPHVIDLVQNHVGFRAGVHGKYNRSTYANEIRTALVTWHDHLRTLLEGGERKVLTYPGAAVSGA